jgi:phosphoserine phosphatase
LTAPATLSTDAFYDAVRSLQPQVAIFDCDGTLWSGDAGSTFMRWTIETGLLSREASEWMNERYRLYKHGEVSELAICGEMVQVYEGLRETELRAAAEQFFAENVQRNVFPEMLALVDELRRGGTEIWAVSSTNDWVIEEGVRGFGIPPERVLSAKIAFADGVATRKLLDVPTDEGKVASIERAGITNPDAVFGNSVHDAAMLAVARRAFPVNPTEALVERSGHEGWAMYYPASVAPASMKT